jgi:hypothetical protein
MKLTPFGINLNLMNRIGYLLKNILFFAVDKGEIKFKIFFFG